MGERAAARAWREATQDGAKIPRPANLDAFLGQDTRELLRKGRVRIWNDLTRLDSFFFERRREGYEDFYHLVDLDQLPAVYRPDDGWWARRRALAAIEDWWEKNKDGLYWDFRKRRFGAQAAKTPPDDGS